MDARGHAGTRKAMHLPADTRSPSFPLTLTYSHVDPHPSIPYNPQPPPLPLFFPLWQALYGANTIQIHRRPGKMGLGSAYVDGLKLVRGKFVVLMDADLSHHPKFIPALYR